MGTDDDEDPQAERARRAERHEAEAIRHLHALARERFRERHPSWAEEHADEISSVVRETIAETLAAHRPPPVHVVVAREPRSEPPRSLRDALGTRGGRTAAVAALGGVLTALVQLARALGWL